MILFPLLYLNFTLQSLKFTYISLKAETIVSFVSSLKGRWLVCAIVNLLLYLQSPQLQKRPLHESVPWDSKIISLSSGMNVMSTLRRVLGKKNILIIVAFFWRDGGGGGHKVQKD